MTSCQCKKKEIKFLLKKVEVEVEVRSQAADLQTPPVAGG